MLNILFGSGIYTGVLNILFGSEIYTGEYFMARLGQEIKNERGEYVSGQWGPGKFTRWWTNDETCPLCGKQGGYKVLERRTWK